jgi:antitoxin component YwqK of YwqJK toxin-antitoxin module
MKVSLVIILLLLGIQSNAQQVTYIGDINAIKYVKNGYNLPIDSIVLDMMSYSDSTCAVYFEKSMKTIAYKSILRKDTLYKYDYWRNGQLKKRTIGINVSPEGETSYYEEVYCQNGQLIIKDFPSSQKKQHIFSYYCNGKVRSELDYIFPVGGFGDIKRWYENGNLEFIEHKDTVSTANSVGIFVKGTIREGVFKYYNMNGLMDSELTYRNDTLIKTIRK